MTEDARELLTEIGLETSLRYAIQLITTSALTAQKRRVAEVEVDDIRRVYSMFSDVKRSIQYLQEQTDLYMFSEMLEKKTKMDIE